MEIAIFVIKGIVVILSAALSIVALVSFFFADNEDVRKTVITFVLSLLVLTAVMS